jgi:hypothetical protein
VLRPLVETAQVKIDPWLVMVVVGRVFGAAEVSVFEPVEVTVEGGDLGVVDEPIDHRSGDTSSPNTSPQRPKGLLEVMIKLARSYPEETSWKKYMLAASGTSRTIRNSQQRIGLISRFHDWSICDLFTPVATAGLHKGVHSQVPLLSTNAAVKAGGRFAPCGATSGLSSSSGDETYASVVVEPPD